MEIISFNNLTVNCNAEAVHVPAKGMLLVISAAAVR